MVFVDYDVFGVFVLGFVSYFEMIWSICDYFLMFVNDCYVIDCVFCEVVFDVYGG